MPFARTSTWAAPNSLTHLTWMNMMRMFFWDQSTGELLQRSLHQKWVMTMSV